MGLPTTTGTALFKVSLTRLNTRLVRGTRTNTRDWKVARMAFMDLVNDSSLDNQPFRALLMRGNELIAAHSFQAGKQEQDYWRGRARQLVAPPDLKLSPIRTGTRRRNLYLDDKTWLDALRIGDNNASEGVRRAVMAIAAATNRSRKASKTK